MVKLYRPNLNKAMTYFALRYRYELRRATASIQTK